MRGTTLNTLLAMTRFRLDAGDIRASAEAWAAHRNISVNVVISSRWLRSTVTITTSSFVNDAMRADLRRHIAGEEQERTAW